MNPSHSPSSAPKPRIATGFDFEPLPNGDVLIEFHGDDGKTINTQVITRDGLARLPVIVHAFFLAVEKGKDAALAFLKNMADVNQQLNHEKGAKP